MHQLKFFIAEKGFCLAFNYFGGVHICIFCQTCKALFQFNTFGFEHLLKTKNKQTKQNKTKQNQKGFQPSLKIVWQLGNRRRRIAGELLFM